MHFYARDLRREKREEKIRQKATFSLSSFIFKVYCTAFKQN